ncbi:hypothetical protein P7C70_g7446, partial [Phenoliferia sp. Uapishka_3]
MLLALRSVSRHRAQLHSALLHCSPSSNRPAAALASSPSARDDPFDHFTSISSEDESAHFPVWEDMHDFRDLWRNEGELQVGQSASRAGDVIWGDEERGEDERVSYEDVKAFLREPEELLPSSSSSTPTRRRSPTKSKPQTSNARPQSHTNNTDATTTSSRPKTHKFNLDLSTLTSPPKPRVHLDSSISPYFPPP